MKTITFAAPRIKRYETDDFQPSGDPRFIAVSLRGTECQLQCDHCRTRMLSALHMAETPEKFTRLSDNMSARGCEGMLLTGGCDRDGMIPLPPFVDVATEAKRQHGFRFAAHTKLANADFAKAAADIDVDLLMLDVVGEEESLRTVYRLKDKTLRDVEASLDHGEAHGLPLAPHIMIGIDHGRITGEQRALDILKGRKLKTLVLVVLSPLRQTPMANVEVDVPGTMDVMSRAREMFPDTAITLGCAKTGGKSQRRLEEHALALEFNAIAYPSEGIVTLAREQGYDVKFSESCCAFLD